MTQSGFFVGCCLAFALLGGCTTDSRLDSSPVTVSLLGDGRVTYAKGFQLTTQKNYLLLSIFSRNSILNDTIQFALIRRGEAAPQGFREDQIIPIPVRTMAVTASSHVGAIDRLEAWDALVGVGSGNQIFARRVKEKFQQGTLEEIHNGLKLDEEKVVALQPEVLIVTGGSETDQTSIESLRKSGVKVIENYEWMETTPLGRAEWIKLIAALLDRLNFAEHQFAQVEMTYQSLKQKVTGDLTQRPKVLLGNEYQGTWYMPGGKSFMAQLLEDAGAHYHWRTTDQTGAIPLNFESVYPIALEADVWLNITDPARQTGKKSDLLQANYRYADFKSVQNNRLYSFTKRLDENGVNDYWESSLYRPDLLLADYIHILHPDLLPDHMLYYCNKLE